MDTVAVLESIQAISLTGAAVVAAVAAIYGITTWRREFVGKKRMDLAEEVLVRFYEARDVIAMIRNPFGYVGEGASREKGEQETQEERDALDRAFVVYERYEKHSEVFNQLRPLRYRFIAHFGAEAAKPFDELVAVLNEIFISARMLGMHYWRQRWQAGMRSEEATERHFEQTQRHEEVFWGLGEGDQIRSRVDQAVGKMEETCQSIIGKEAAR